MPGGLGAPGIHPALPFFRTSPKGCANYAVTGVTRDGSGTPLGGCTVFLHSVPSGALLQTTTSDASGNFSFPVAFSTTQNYFTRALDSTGHLAASSLSNIWSSSQGVTPAPTAFSPLMIPTPAIWLDGADTSVLLNGVGAPTANNGNVATWADKSPWARNVAASTAPTRSDASAGPGNTLTSVLFGAGASMGLGGFVMARPTTCYIVAKSTGTDYTVAIYMIDGGGVSNTLGMAWYPDNQTYLCYSGGSVPSTHNTTQASYHLYNGIFSPTAGVSRLSVDYNAYTAQSDFDIRTSTTGLRVGAVGDNSGGYLNGNMCEIIVWDRLLKSWEDLAVSRYLCAKWGTPAGF